MNINSFHLSKNRSILREISEENSSSAKNFCEFFFDRKTFYIDNEIQFLKVWATNLSTKFHQSIHFKIINLSVRYISERRSSGDARVVK